MRSAPRTRRRPRRRRTGRGSIAIPDHARSFGGNSVRERAPPRRLRPALESPEGPETCNYERATVNHILSSLHPEGGLVYFTPVRPGHYRMVSTPQNCFWCCVGTGLKNHAKYGELGYTAEDGDLDGHLAIHLRVPGWHDGPPQVRVNGAPAGGARPAHDAPRGRRTAPDLRASGAAVACRGHDHHAPSPACQRGTAPRRLAVGVVPLRAHRARGRGRPG
ncbi:beta-L-arabinofuranosidase domain-containing protein [Streptomyces sp. NPDC097941]|uniref:beta-L-arabinofuranosidase domain-containing protein n=1 Tax=Streptomyces sp. NPDC097941 TaxID=3155685 RepID=UPI0033175218